jgi:predicted metal-dependent phosphoesterase TrpH
MNPVRNTKALEKENKISNGVKFADLHLHTIFSDGTYKPEELAEKAAKSGLSCIAIVDHDTVAGFPRAKEAAGLNDIEILSGIELSAEYDGLEIHILGYLVDYCNKDLLKKLEFLKNNRIERIYKMTEKLKGLEVALEAEDVFALLKAGLVKSIAEAFRKYIGDKGPAYFCGFKLTPREAIELIRQAGGVPVLAHPYTLGRDDLITQFVKDGLMGLEVYYPEHTQAMVNFYLKLSRELGLLATGGSDCHGEAKPQVMIGSIKIPYELVEQIKAAKEKV